MYVRVRVGVRVRVCGVFVRSCGNGEREGVKERAREGGSESAREDLERKLLSDGGQVPEERLIQRDLSGEGLGNARHITRAVLIHRGRLIVP